MAHLCVQLVPPAAGSGLPEVRTMLSGSSLPDSFLGIKVGAAKAVGLMLGIAAQLPLGSEGPFVHISAATARYLRKWYPFSSLAEKDVRSTVLMSMVSVGSGATLSAPISGALLGLEFMMPHVIDMSSYMCVFTAAAIGSLSTYLLKLASGQGYTLLFVTDIKMSETTTVEKLVRVLMLTLPLGALCGLFGGLFVHLQDEVAYLYKKLRAYGARPTEQLAQPLVSASRKPSCPPYVVDLVLLAAVGTIVALLVDFEPRFGMGPAVILGMCFSIDPFTEPLMNVDIVTGFFLLFLAKFVITAAALRLPIPNGCVAPCLVIGAVLGRLWAHIVDTLLRDTTPSLEDEDFAWFAIIGSAAFTAGVCRTFSIVVAVFELLAVPSLILPLSFATLTSMTVANVLSPSIFDSIATFKGLPVLPVLCNPHAPEMMRRIGSIMHDNIDDLCVPRHCSVVALRAFFEKFNMLKDAPSMIGIVEPHSGGNLMLGSLKARHFPLLLETLADSKAAKSVRLKNVDVFSEVAHLGLLEHTPLLMPNQSLRTAYMEAQTSKHASDAVFYVCESGMVLGVVTANDLKVAAHF
eukprot:gnl/MRDRNA2_/MRDRNA2_83815_c0_seq1.p1 gnl/MRDRNA2_/MRDRNA2_83815_c0~~gnl/MRDRNA2_/MRDRNA2_83815_c0_seq1.p1  ORF type:complete len:609 (+),score=85.24 gnl/MRDRNA2_/MRDRNA2_83815_c0_seq1:98-1828(+)